MISFIIIGRNEGWKLTKCLESIFNTIIFNKLSDYEIIYVDSNSTDNSLERANSFSDVKCYKITGAYNSAIGRNIGFLESKGEALFFIDGDMEIMSDFFSLVFDSNYKLKYDFVSGQFVNYFYDYNNNFLYKENYDKTIEKGDQFHVTTGGLFIIKRQCWILVNGMKNKYKRSQDLDLGLRLTKKGIKLLRKKELMAVHHTISYNDKNRMWKMLINKSHFYGRSMLYRDHIFNLHVYPLILKYDYSLTFLVLSLLLMACFFSIYPLLIYFVILSIRSLKSSGYRFNKFFVFMAYYILRDFSVFLGFFFFYSKKDFIIKYEKTDK